MYIFQHDRALLQHALSRIIKEYGLSGRVLDVGAGSFLRYASFFPAGTQYDSQDIAASDKIQHTFIGDAAHIPAQDATYDVVLSTQVLEHVPDPFAVLQEMKRLVKPGGYILISCPQSNEAHEIPHDYHRFTQYALRTYGKNLELNVVHIEPVGDFWSMMHRYGTRFFIDAVRLHDHPWLGRGLSFVWRMSSPIISWMDRVLVSAEVKGKYVLGWICLYQKQK